MEYLDNITKIIPEETSNYNENINIKMKIYTYIQLINTIKIYFSTKNMLIYFGNKNNLKGIQTRDIYKKLIEYFISLFIYKMRKIKNIDLMNIKNDDNNHPYICLIAQSLSIIRASIKKYVRLRTSDSQPYYCKKKYLEERNRSVYGCSVPVNEFEYCPSFEYLRNKKKKTCKEIIKKAMETNDIFTGMSSICIFPVKHIKSIHVSSDDPKYTKIKGTRHIYKGIPSKLKKYKHKTVKSKNPPPPQNRK